MFRATEISRLGEAAREGRAILNRLPDDDGYARWVMTTERLLREMLGSTQLWANFVRGYQGEVVMQAPPEHVMREMQRRKVRFHVEVAEAVLEWTQRRAEDGPIPRDPLIEARFFAQELSLSAVSTYIDEAERAFGRNEWEQSVGHVGHAFERTVHGLAELVSGERKARDFGGALSILSSRGVITEETRKALAVRDVSLWGWLSIKGRHAEGAGTGKPADEWTEARFALDWAGSAISFLGAAYQSWLDEQRDKRAH